MNSFKRFLIAGLFLVFGVGLSPAATVSLDASDAGGTSSFNSAGNWNNNAAPNSTNSYFTSNFLLRSPANATAYTFAGGSLSIDAGGRFLMKGTGGQVMTVTNLIMNGGVADYANVNTDNNSETLAGSITLNAGATSCFGALSGTGSETLLITAPISGSGNIQIAGANVNAGADNGTVIFTGSNTYTGSTTVAGGTLLINGTLGNANVIVTNGGTFGGTGTITPRAAGRVSVLTNGTIAPGGTSIGTLIIDGSSTSANALSLGAGARFNFRLNAGLQSDSLCLTNGAAGDISFSSNAIAFTDLSSGALAFGSYVLFTADASGAYAGLTLDSSNYIAAGLTIGSGLNSYAGARLQLVKNDIVLQIVSNVFVPAVQVAVDYAVDKGASTQVASGFLHGISSNYPSQYLIDGVKVNSIRGADLTYPGQYLPGLLDPATHARIMRAGAPSLIIGLYYGHGSYWPGVNGDNFSQWINEVTGVYNEALTNNFQVYAWIPWNEPDGQWTGTYTTAEYYAAHQVAYQTIKALNPNARIEAPECSSFNFSYITAFLSYCQSNNCVPDVVSWHELTDGSPPDIEGHTSQLQTWLQTNGIGARPLAITEYQGGSYGGLVTYNPAQTTIYIAKMERSVTNGFLYGLHSDWNQTGSDPTFKASLGDTADASSSSFPRGSWWVYNGYKDLTGRLVQTTTTGATLVDALAGADSVMDRSVILIGNATTSAQIIGFTLTNLNQANFLIRDGKVHVHMEAYGSNGIVFSPSVLMDADCAVANNAVSLILPSVGAQYGCRIYVSSATADAPTATYEAGNLPFSTSAGDSATVVSQANASGGQAVILNANSIGDQINFTLNVPATGVYQLSGQMLAAPTNAMVQLYLNGQAYGGPKDEYAALSAPFTTSFGNIGLLAGTNTLSFSIVNTNTANTATSFSAGFDNFTLTQLNLLEAFPGKTADGTKFTLTFDRYADPTLTYQVLAADNLLTNFWAVIWSSTGAQNVAGSVTVQDDESLSNQTTRFLRLNISRP